MKNVQNPDANESAGSQDDATTFEAGWPLRAWIVSALGALAALCVHTIVEAKWASSLFPNDDLKYGFAALVGGSAVLFGLLLERTKVRWSLGFAALGGSFFGLIVYSSGSHNVYWNYAPQGLRIACAIVVIVIATVLFQAWRDHSNGVLTQPDTSNAAGDYVTIKTISYHRAYNHAWNDVILWIGSWVVVGIVFAITLLLSQLFKLIGLYFLDNLLEHAWFRFALTGAAFGAGIGLLRDRGHIITSIQRVITMVLSVLAPILAFGLAFFLLALPFTGLQSLWAATRATSPILFACIVGALVLASAVLSDGTRHETRHPVLRASLFVLSLCVLPLAIIAAVSIGLRVDQYGLTPDRLWAITFTSIALVLGLAYLVTILRFRRNAAPHLRKANLLVAFGVAALAFLLATPVLNFGAISTRNQIARLEDGRIDVEAFDWISMRYSYGETGRDALRKLMRTSPNPEVRKLAAQSLAHKDRWSFERERSAQSRNANTDANAWTVIPRGTTLPPALFEKLKEHGACSNQSTCLIEHKPGSKEAIVVSPYDVTPYQLLESGIWGTKERAKNAQRLSTDGRLKAMKAGTIETRTVTLRQVYLGGVAVGEPFE